MTYCISTEVAFRRLNSWGVALLLETVDLELICLDEATLGQPTADVLSLVALELKNLTHTRSAETGIDSDRTKTTIRKEQLTSMTVPLHANSFLQALTIFLRSYSLERP